MPSVNPLVSRFKNASKAFGNVMIRSNRPTLTPGADVSFKGTQDVPVGLLAPGVSSTTVPEVADPAGGCCVGAEELIRTKSTAHGRCLNLMALLAGVALAIHHEPLAWHQEIELPKRSQPCRSHPAIHLILAHKSLLLILVGADTRKVDHGEAARRLQIRSGRLDECGTIRDMVEHDMEECDVDIS